MSLRVQINRGQIKNKFKKIDLLIDEAKKRALGEAAAWVMLRSPVDTGTYMDNHNIGQGNSVPSSASISSKGKPKNQNWTAHANEAEARLAGQIESLPEDWKRATIANTSEHADEVEYKHGYGVYTSLRAAWPTLKAKAVSEAEAKFK
jgi:hypothetical protein